jgi:hypothetical protein
MNPAGWKFPGFPERETVDANMKRRKPAGGRHLGYYKVSWVLIKWTFGLDLFAGMTMALGWMR